MVTKRDDDDNRQGEYRAICLWKMDWQSFAMYTCLHSATNIRDRNAVNCEEPVHQSFYLAKVVLKKC